MEFNIQNRLTEGKGSKNNIKTGRGTKHKSLIQNNRGLLEGLCVGGWAGWAKWARGIEKDTCWDEHCVLHVGGESLDCTPEIITVLYAN